MTKDEMENRISMAIKDPILQQGFEIICKELTDLQKEVIDLRQDKNKLEEENNKLLDVINNQDVKIAELEQELTVEKDQLQEEINLHLHAEEYIKSLEKENAELQERYNKVDIIGYDALKNLAKAKDIIKELIKYDIPTLDYEQAEQFLGTEPMDKEKDAWQKYYDFGR